MKPVNQLPLYFELSEEIKELANEIASAFQTALDIALGDITVLIGGIDGYKLIENRYKQEKDTPLTYQIRLKNPALCTDEMLNTLRASFPQADIIVGTFNAVSNGDFWILAETGKILHPFAQAQEGSREDLFALSRLFTDSHLIETPFLQKHIDNAEKNDIATLSLLMECYYTWFRDGKAFSPTTATVIHAFCINQDYLALREKIKDVCSIIHGFPFENILKVVEIRAQQVIAIAQTAVKESTKHSKTPVLSQQDDIDALHNKIQNQQIQIDLLTRSSNIIKSNNKEFAESYQALKIEKEKISSDLDKSKEELTTERKKTLDLESTNKKIAYENKSLVNKISKISKTQPENDDLAKQKDEEIAKLREEIRQLKSGNDTLSKKNKHLNEQISTLSNNAPKPKPTNAKTKTPEGLTQAELDKPIPDAPEEKPIASPPTGNKITSTKIITTTKPIVAEKRTEPPKPKPIATFEPKAEKDLLASKVVDETPPSKEILDIIQKSEAILIEYFKKIDATDKKAHKTIAEEALTSIFTYYNKIFPGPIQIARLDYFFAICETWSDPTTLPRRPKIDLKSPLYQSLTSLLSIANVKDTSKGNETIEIGIDRALEELSQKKYLNINSSEQLDYLHAILCYAHKKQTSAHDKLAVEKIMDAIIKRSNALPISSPDLSIIIRLYIKQALEDLNKNGKNSIIDNNIADSIPSYLEKTRVTRLDNNNYDIEHRNLCKGLSDHVSRIEAVKMITHYFNVLNGLLSAAALTNEDELKQRILHDIEMIAFLDTYFINITAKMDATKRYDTYKDIIRDITDFLKEESIDKNYALLIQAGETILNEMDSSKDVIIKIFTDLGDLLIILIENRKLIFSYTDDKDQPTDTLSLKDASYLYKHLCQQYTWHPIELHDFKLILKYYCQIYKGTRTISEIQLARFFVGLKSIAINSVEKSPLSDAFAKLLDDYLKDLTSPSNASLYHHNHEFKLFVSCAKTYHEAITKEPQNNESALLRFMETIDNALYYSFNGKYGVLAFQRIQSIKRECISIANKLKDEPNEQSALNKIITSLSDNNLIKSCLENFVKVGDVHRNLCDDRPRFLLAYNELKNGTDLTPMTFSFYSKYIAMPEIYHDKSTNENGLKRAEVYCIQDLHRSYPAIDWHKEFPSLKSKLESICMASAQRTGVITPVLLSNSNASASSSLSSVSHSNRISK